MSVLLRVQALGPMRLSSGEGAIATLTQPRRLALLAYLMLADPRGLHSRDTLIALLWPESTADQGRHALRSSLHAIRKSLGDGVIVTAGQTLVGVDREHVACDVDALETELANGRAGVALDRYQELLSGFHVSGAPEFERWLDDARASLRRRVVEAALRAADAHHAAGDAGAALRLGQIAQRVDPDDERVLRRCLELSAANGDLAGAHRSYRSFIVRLARDYDAEPAHDTAALMARLSTQFAGRNDASERTSIALLPIVDATGLADGEQLCESLWNGLFRRLTRLSGVRMYARGAVSPYGRRSISALLAAREIGADIAVDGRLCVPRGGEDVEVRLEVIDARDGSPIREVTFRAGRHNLFALEGPLTSAIAPTLDALPAGTAGPPNVRAPRAAETYTSYVRGTFLFLCAAHVGGRVEDLHRSRELFERALALDPEFAPAYCGLANYFAVCAARNLLQPFAEHFGHALELSDRALELDPTQAIPHVHYGVQAMYLESDWARAGAEFHRSVALDPNYVEGRRFLGVYLGAMGAGEESISELREASRIEPQMPACRNSLADALLASGRHDEAIVELRAALQLDGGYRAARERLVRCLERSGRFSEAVAERRRGGDTEAAERFARAFDEDGESGYQRERAIELRALINRLAARADSVPSDPADLFSSIELQLALAHAELGEWADALRWEERACATQPGRRQWFLGRPELAPCAKMRMPATGVSTERSTRKVVANAGRLG